MMMRHALFVTILAASWALGACASPTAGPPAGATNPAWLVGTWQGTAWQAADGHELWGVVETSYGAAAVSLKRVR